MLLPCLAFGVASEELDLPSVTIEGKDELQEKDNFYFDDDLSKHWQIEGDFDFGEELQDLEFGGKKDSTKSTQRVGFLDFWFGYGHQAQLKAVYHNLQNGLLDFEVESKNFWYDEDWYSCMQSFLWSPDFGRAGIDFSFAELDANADSLKTKVTKGGFSWDLSLSDSLLQELSLFFSAENLQQDYLDQTQTKSYSNFGISTKAQIQDILLTGDFFHYSDAFNAELKARKNINKWGFYTFDFWAGFSRDRIMPSIGFLGLYFLPNKIFIHIENTPEISQKTHFDLLSENYAQSLDYELSQELVPLDFTLKCGYKRYFTIFNNASYKMNHIYYSKVEDEENYLAHEKDFLLNKTGAEANFEHSGYGLSVSYYRDMVVNQEKDYIPYEPGAVGKVTLSHTRFKMVTTELSFFANQLIKDDAGLEVEDKLDLSLEQNWVFSDALSFNLRFLNLLDKKLNKLSAYPERGQQVYAGVKWYF